MTVCDLKPEREHPQKDVVSFVIQILKRGTEKKEKKTVTVTL